MNSLKGLADKTPLRMIREVFSKVTTDENENYEQFETRSMNSELVTFRENDKEFRLFGTNIHVKIGAYIACAIGFAVTICFCFTYTFYHTRGMGRNEFLDHIELVDLVFAFIIGLPCHVILFYGIYNERKVFFNPFLIFYLTNFILNIIFTLLTMIAVLFDFHEQLFGNITWDISWTIFQIAFTSLQGLAIYVVLKCRRYTGAKEHFKTRSLQRHSPGVMADGVSFET